MPRIKTPAQLDAEIAAELGPYRVNDQRFVSYFAATAEAKKVDAQVVEVRDDGSEIVRWRPAPPAKARTRHVIRNADGSFTEFGKVRR